MDLGLKNKTVIVTGGSKGIGAGISEVFAQEGANLIINYHSNKEEAETLSSMLIEKYGVQVKLIKGDVGSEEDVSKIFDCADELGGADVLVNNAGRGLTCFFRR